MKRKLLAGVIVLLMLTIVTYVFAQVYVTRPYGSGQELFTANSGWKLLRTAGALDGPGGATTDLTATDLCFYTKVAGSTTSPVDTVTNIAATTGMIDVWTELGWGVNAVQIALFSVDDSANDNFDLEIYAWADSMYAPAQIVYLTTGDACIVGTYDCQKHPTAGTAQTSGLWVDTISGTDRWPTSVDVIDSGNNGMCTMTFDLTGCRYLWVRLWNDSTGGTAAAKIGAVIRKY